ncbi:MAG: cytochrome c oxidase subunit II [Elusimicrobia bacterium]|nr:cytochrome c oxidase subunit II [Elusimicrobiota bacterium]
MSDWKRAVPTIGALAAVLTFLLNRLLEAVHLMPLAVASREAAIVDSAFAAVLRIDVLVFSVVIAALVYIVAFFRADSGEGARFTHSPGRLVETVWLAFSCVLTFGLAAYGSEEFLALRGDRRADVDVQVKAVQWSWDFSYPAYGATPATMILPRGKRARISLSSDDVLHALSIPAFRLKQDALPGRVTTLYVTPLLVGRYEIVCAELCGLDHTAMSSTVEVVEPEEFEARLKGDTW